MIDMHEPRAAPRLISPVLFLRLLGKERE